MLDLSNGDKIIRNIRSTHWNRCADQLGESWLKTDNGNERLCNIHNE